MKKYTQTLEELGLTPNEAKIYQALLELKNGTIWTISKHADIHRRNTYDAIGRLIARGLAYQVLPKKTLTYAPVHPEKLTELMNDKVQDLAKAIPGLTARFNKLELAQSLAIYRGVQGLKNYIKLTIEEGEQGNELLVLGSKGIFFEPGIKAFAKKHQKRLAKIGGKVIYDEEMQKYPEELRLGGKKKYKFLAKKYCGNTTVAIFGDYVAIYSGVHTKAVDEDITIFILQDKSMASDYRKWFDFMWDHLPTAKPCLAVGR